MTKNAYQGCVTCSYADNPWFPEDLRADMERDRRRDPDKYAHVWLGEYQRDDDPEVSPPT